MIYAADISVNLKVQSSTTFANETRELETISKSVKSYFLDLHLACKHVLPLDNWKDDINNVLHPFPV